MVGLVGALVAFSRRRLNADVLAPCGCPALAAARAVSPAASEAAAHAAAELL